MKPKITFTILFLVFSYSLMAQNPYLVLTYTAEDNGEYVQFDSIKVKNRTQDCDTVLYWPDTVLVLGTNVSMQEITGNENGLQVLQNYPNPVTGQTTVDLYVPEQGNVYITISDVTGRILLSSEYFLTSGLHSFRYVPGNSGITFFTVSMQGMKSSIRVLNNGSNSSTVKLEYIGSVDASHSLKSSYFLQNFTFSYGDILLYVGYADTLESGILETPMIDDTSTFQFAFDIPCPGTPTVTYEGRIYNTVQILSQCWFKENLNVGEMILVTENSLDNDTIERYCYNNIKDSCDKYGGLYQWNEMMQYNSIEGTQGICPPGWHLPSDEEWQVLEGAIDSQYGIGDTEWDDDSWRGGDAGINLKSITGWENGNGTDLFGFSGLPGGFKGNSSFFNSIGTDAYWWTSTPAAQPYARHVRYFSPSVQRFRDFKPPGFSVRCIKDE